MDFHETRETIQGFNDNLYEIENTLRSIVIKQEKTFTVLGVRLFTVTTILTITAKVILPLVSVGLAVYVLGVYVATGRLPFDSPVPTPISDTNTDTTAHCFVRVPEPGGNGGTPITVSDPRFKQSLLLWAEPKEGSDAVVNGLIGSYTIGLKLIISKRTADNQWFYVERIEGDAVILPAAGVSASQANPALQGWVNARLVACNNIRDLPVEEGV